MGEISDTDHWTGIFPECDVIGIFRKVAQEGQVAAFIKLHFNEDAVLMSEYGYSQIPRFRCFTDNLKKVLCSRKFFRNGEQIRCIDEIHYHALKQNGISSVLMNFLYNGMQKFGVCILRAEMLI